MVECGLLAELFGGLLFEAFDVLGNVTSEHTCAAGRDFEHLVNDAVEEVTVVADEDDGAFEQVDRFLQYFLGFDIKVIGRFVENHAVARVHQHLGEGDAIFLTTRKDGCLLEGFVAGEEQCTQGGARVGVVVADGGGFDFLQHVVFWVELFGL